MYRHLLQGMVNISSYYIFGSMHRGALILGLRLYQNLELDGESTFWYLFNEMDRLWVKRIDTLSLYRPYYHWWSISMVLLIYSISYIWMIRLLWTMEDNLTRESKSVIETVCLVCKLTEGSNVEHPKIGSSFLHTNRPSVPSEVTPIVNLIILS